MRQFPLEVEADFAFRGLDVFDWYQGRMSSRRLLVLIKMLERDDDSCLAREWRDGDWSLRQYMDAAIVNELRRLRADQAAIHAQYAMDVDSVDSPYQKQEAERELEKHRAARAHIMGQLTRKT